jgi:hypothetical protein
VPRMIELIKQSAVPANVMRSAARGALSLPAGEMVEILVYLSGHHLFGEQAKLALAGFDQQSMQPIAANPATPQEVLLYLAAPENVRAELLPALLENPSLPSSALLELAMSHSHDVLAAMVASGRVRGDSAVLHVLAGNADLAPAQRAQIESLLASEEPPSSGAPVDEDILAINQEVSKYITEHAAEIAAEEARRFELTDLTEDEKKEIHAQKDAQPTDEERKRMSPLQKIASLTVGERVQLAMKGNREERFILIRDGCKVVSSAVLECPKLSDQEIETFAAMKNVQESVLRGIAGKRRFMKLYPVVRALVSNPRCPLDVALPLLKSLLVQDLRNLSMNKNVPDTLRKLAFKMFKEKTSTKKGE